MFVLWLGLVTGTFISEDLTSVAAGLLISRGEMSALGAISGCAVGILLGDWGLWLMGRVGGRAARSSSWLARRLPVARAEELRSWLERNSAAAITASRFLPGTRLALYFTAGVVGMSAARFGFWTLVAVSVWTPMVVLLTARAGEVHVAAALGALVLIHAARILAQRSARRRAAAWFARWRRWEFWPMWLFYSPVGLWVMLLSIRYGGLSTITAANPGIEDGGVVGESKFQILSRLPADSTIPTVLVDRDLPDRVQFVLDHQRRAVWEFPLVLKPDVGQRGVGVRLARNIEDIKTYLERQPGPVLVQPYDEGPFEAGVFYYRMPGSRHGRIFSITDKQFPVIVGDGRSTIEELIWAHPRYHLQARLFLARHAGIRARVLGPGERFQLAIAGNHAQGTLFRSGSHLLTPALEQRIDGIARSCPGFFVGRFDIRYRNVDDFKAGRDIAIVELNGATAESTDIYDPDSSLIHAYRRLFTQWATIFAIGAANRAQGAPVTPLRRLCGLVRVHLTTRVAHAISD